jgi:glycosyltransferase involved in cell wall biosynthesis
VGSAHLLGGWIRRSQGVRWVADFRDPWSADKLYPYFPGYRALNRRMEQRVLANADHVTTVSTTLHRLLTGLGNLPPEGVTIIENGYDEDDVRLLPPPDTTRFTITYTGEFSRIRKPDAFVAAIELLLSRGDIAVSELRVAFAGKQTHRFVPSHPPFEQLGYLTHDRLDALREESDLLLLIQGDSPTAPAKVYEYLGSNRPTLSIADRGNVGSELVMRARGGVSTTHDAEEIAAAILPYYRAWKSGLWTYTPDWELIRSFTRRRLTGQLAAVLAEVAR